MTSQRDRIFTLDQLQQLLDSLLHLLKEYCLPIRPTAMSGAFGTFQSFCDVEERRILWPDLTCTLLTILSSFALNPRNHRIMLSHRMCLSLILILANFEDKQVSFLAGQGVMNLSVSFELPPNTVPSWITNYQLWIEKSLTGERRAMIQALRSLQLLCCRSSNVHCVSNSLQPQVFLHVVNVILCQRDAEIRILALEVLLHAARLGDRIKLRLAQSVICLPVLVQMMQCTTFKAPESGEDSESSRIRRTSAAAFAAIMHVPENYRLLEEHETSLFVASCKYYEVAQFIAPLLAHCSK